MTVDGHVAVLVQDVDRQSEAARRAGPQDDAVHRRVLRRPHGGGQVDAVVEGAPPTAVAAGEPGAVDRQHRLGPCGLPGGLGRGRLGRGALGAGGGDLRQPGLGLRDGDRGHGQRLDVVPHGGQLHLGGEHRGRPGRGVGGVRHTRDPGDQSTGDQRAEQQWAAARTRGRPPGCRGTEDPRVPGALSATPSGHAPARSKGERPLPDSRGSSPIQTPRDGSVTLCSACPERRAACDVTHVSHVTRDTTPARFVTGQIRLCSRPGVKPIAPRRPRVGRG